MNFKNLLIVAAGALMAACSSASKTADSEEWVLDWVEDFDGEMPDTSVWVRTERGTADWAKTQSDDPRCVEMRDGMLVLRGIINDDTSRDTSLFLCGGVTTKGHKAFEPGRVEVRARFGSAQGAWPAIWMLPYRQTDANKWPHGGEIDLMEHLNHDSIAYQTVHSYYTYVLKNTDNPRASVHPEIDPGAFNVYGVDLFADSLVFHINGVPTNTYPRVEGAEEQYPYFQPMYLLLDMQLGGKWVGEVDPAQLPVEMEIDWVRHYRRAH